MGRKWIPAARPVICFALIKPIECHSLGRKEIWTAAFERSSKTRTVVLFLYVLKQCHRLS